MSIPEWQRNMSRAVPTGMLREIVAENRVAPGARGRSPIVHEAGEARPNRAVVTPYAKDPPGWEIVSRMMDRQDEVDRQDRILAAAKRLAEMKGMVR
jgi:hypothetical protein